MLSTRAKIGLALGGVSAVSLLGILLFQKRRGALNGPQQLIAGDTPLPAIPFCTTPQQAHAQRALAAAPPQDPLRAALTQLLIAFANGHDDPDDLKPLCDRVIDLALAHRLERLAALVKFTKGRLRIKDLPTDEKWPGTTTSIREYMAQALPRA